MLILNTTVWKATKSNVGTWCHVANLKSALRPPGSVFAVVSVLVYSPSCCKHVMALIIYAQLCIDPLAFLNHDTSRLDIHFVCEQITILSRLEVLC